MEVVKHIPQKALTAFKSHAHIYTNQAKMRDVTQFYSKLRLVLSTNHKGIIKSNWGTVFASIMEISFQIVMAPDIRLSFGSAWTQSGLLGFLKMLSEPKSTSNWKVLLPKLWLYFLINWWYLLIFKVIALLGCFIRGY